jgi:O-antigen/teichoic acid export membrane protein
MSIVATAPVKEVGRAGILIRLGNTSWAVADQGLISATNFITMILLARGLSPADFGGFTLIYSVLLFAGTFQSALITQPHNILGTTRRGEDYGRYTMTTAVVQICGLAVAALLVLAVAGFTYAANREVAPLLLTLAPSIVAWQLQEFVRRVLYTEQRLAAAFSNDVISYGGQTVAVAALWRHDVLTAPVALYALAATSALAAAYGLWQLRGSLAWGLDRATVRENWHFGKWLAGGELLRWLSSVEMYQYLTAAILGTAATGMLKSAQIIFGPARLISFSLASVLPIRFARTLAATGRAGLDAQLKMVYLLIVPLLGSYCLLVAMSAGTLLRLLYGDKYSGGVRVLTLYAASAFLAYLMQVMSAALRATRLTRCIFRVYVYTSLIAVSLGWLLIKTFAAEGALIGMILTSLIANFLFWRAYRRGMTCGLAVTHRGVAVRSHP